jgi:hypothetical protein
MAQIAGLPAGDRAAGTTAREKDSSNGARAAGQAAGDQAAGDRPAGDRAAADRAAGAPAGRSGSLASVLGTLREAASAHDDQAGAPGLPETGPLPGQPADE